MITQPTAPNSGQLSQKCSTFNPDKILKLLKKNNYFPSHPLMIHNMLFGQIYKK